MRPSIIGVVVLCGLVAVCAASGSAGETRPGAAASDETPKRARELLDRKLATLHGAERGQVLPIKDETVARLFPGYSFYVLRFRQFPVAIAPPAPLQANTLLVVQPDDSVALLTDRTGLEDFVRATLPPVTAEAPARDAVRAWLRLTQEFRQDGFLQFSLPDDAVQVTSAPDGGQHVTGKAAVTPQGGNQGGIVVSLVFDQTGRLATVSEVASIDRGIRPICQATKLLDPDPIVRGMAEQDLLVMGKAARAYLDEQRAAASPQLQQAIDRIWRRIFAGNR